MYCFGLASSLTFTVFVDYEKNAELKCWYSHGELQRTIDFWIMLSQLVLCIIGLIWLSACRPNGSGRVQGKLEITGGYVFRVRSLAIFLVIIVVVNLCLTGINLASSPIEKSVLLIAALINDGYGFIIFAIFAGMRRNALSAKIVRLQRVIASIFFGGCTFKRWTLLLLRRVLLLLQQLVPAIKMTQVEKTAKHFCARRICKII